MNLRQLDVFRSIMAEGSTVSAAARLRVSQPAVSKLLKEIEAAIGFALFQRVGGRLLPTPEARSLFEQIDRMEVGLERINRLIGDLRESKRGRLSIVAMPLMLNRQVPDLICRFLGDHPGVDVTIRSHDVPRRFHSVAIGEVDIAIEIARRNHDDINIESLIDLELACVMPRDHKLATRTFITEEDIADEKVILMRNVMLGPPNYDDNDDFYPNRIGRCITVSESVLAFELISRGAGIGVVDLLTIRDLRRDNVAVAKFIPKIEFNVALLTSSRWPASKVAKEFSSYAKSHFGSLQRDLREFVFG